MNSVQATTTTTSTGRVSLELALDRGTGPRQQLLSVMDLPFERQGSRPEKLLTVFGESYPNSHHLSPWLQLHDQLSLLPPLKENTARIFDIGECHDRGIRSGLHDAIRNYFSQAYADLPKRGSIIDDEYFSTFYQMDPRKILSQWQKSAQIDLDTGEDGPVFTTIGNFKSGVLTRKRVSLLCLNHDNDKLIGELTFVDVVLCALIEIF